MYFTALGLLALLVRSWQDSENYRHAVGPFLHLIALLLIAIATLPVGLDISNWLGVGIIALGCLGVGMPVIGKFHHRFDNLTLISTLSLIGALLGAIMGVSEYVAEGGRAGVGNNPIHYSGIVVVLGFCALGGLYSASDKYRPVFLVGPTAGLVAALASGSRGPLLAVLGLSAIAWIVSAIWHRHRKAFWALSLSGGILLALIIGTTADGARALVGLVEALKGNTITSAGYADDIRATLYMGGLQAYLESPVWGHGFSNLMDAAARYMPVDTRYTRFDHLHNDLIDFLVVGGLLGGLSYLLLLAGPLTTVRHFFRAEARGIVMMALMLSAGYGLLGLTNAMLGILPQTVLFAVLSGCVFMLDRDTSG